MRKLIITIGIILSGINLNAQDCYTVTKVENKTDNPDLSSKRFTFGVKQITEEVLSEKYSLCEQNAIPVMVEITRVGTPSTTFRIAGVGAATETTQILLKIHFGDKVIDGIGESATTASYAFIELKEGKVPFSKSSIGIAMKKAIIDAVNKL